MRIDFYESVMRAAIKDLLRQFHNIKNKKMEKLQLSSEVSDKLKSIDEVMMVRKEFTQRIETIDRALLELTDVGTGSVVVVIKPYPGGSVDIPAVMMKRILHKLQDEYLLKLNETTKDLNKILN